MVRFIAISSFMGQKIRTVARNEYITGADLRGGREGHILGGPNSFNFMQFWEKNCQNRILEPLPHGNPGSATA